MNLDAILPPARQLRIAAMAREADRDNSEAEYDARTAFVALAEGMGVIIDAERPARWVGLGQLAAALEAASITVADTKVGSFEHVGPVMSLSVLFGQVARAMGYRAETPIRTIDETARDTVEGYREAAE